MVKFKCIMGFLKSPIQTEDYYVVFKSLQTSNLIMPKKYWNLPWHTLTNTFATQILHWKRHVRKPISVGHTSTNSFAKHTAAHRLPMSTGNALNAPSNFCSAEAVPMRKLLSFADSTMWNIFTLYSKKYPARQFLNI